MWNKRRTIRLQFSQLIRAHRVASGKRHENPDDWECLREDELICLLNVSRYSRIISNFLLEYWWERIPDSISNEVFDTVMSLPPKKRHIFFPILDHVDLSFLQMYTLCMEQEMESFENAFQEICLNDCFTEKDMHHLLYNAKFNSVMLSICLAAFSAENVACDNKKVIVAKAFQEQKFAKQETGIRFDVQ